MSAPEFVFKILHSEQWKLLSATGEFSGSPDDQRDGFLHLACAHQLSAAIEKHFSGCTRLVIAKVSGRNPRIRMELSRGGQDFPHLYGVLRSSEVLDIMEWSPGEPLRW
jgi:uncharacterized protein (DUF952 family)